MNKFIGVFIVFLILQPQVYARPSYDGINDSVFTDLPNYPDNFAVIKRDFYTSQISDYQRIGEQYWKQPEWYPTWERNGLGWFNDHDYSRWGGHGYGFMPV